MFTKDPERTGNGPYLLDGPAKKSHTLIFGGTRGFGRAMATTALYYQHQTTVIGNQSVAAAREDSELAGAEIIQADVTDADSIQSALSGLDRAPDYCVWAVGRFLRQPLAEVDPDELRQMMEVHFQGLVLTVRAVHQMMKDRQQRYHLVVIGSTGSWRVCKHEAVYSALKAAQAHMVRVFAQELVADLPRSRVTLAQLSGLKSPQQLRKLGHQGSPDGLMTPKTVAEMVWAHVFAHHAPFQELQFLRNVKMRPSCLAGSKCPEHPFEQP